MRNLTREQRRDIRAIAAKRDRDIDFSDAAEVLDWSGAEMGKFFRPRKQPVTLRLDADVLAWLKSTGRGYQTRVNFLLRHAMARMQGRPSSTGRRSRQRGAAAKG